MSNVVPFDTLALALALREEAGFTKTDVSSLAAKNDLRETELRLEAKIESIKADLLKSILGFLMAAVTVNTAVVIGAMFGLAKLLGH